MTNRLCQFMNGYAAAVQLLNRAGTNGFLVEYVCLATSVADATLRMALILKHQLVSGTSEVLLDLLYQGGDDAIVSEREVYRRARDAGLLAPQLFTELEALYQDRNRVVHRYIISDIRTSGVFEIARRYEELIPRLGEITGDLEARQMETGVGMTTAGEHMSEAEVWKDIDRASVSKHGSSALAHAFSKKAT